LPTIGVLAIQGDFLEHKQVLARLGVDAPEIRLPSQLEGIDGLISQRHRKKIKKINRPTM